MNTTTSPPAKARIVSIDALRGFVIVIMLVDHLRDMFFLNVRLVDPVDVTTTEPIVYILRLLSSLCAPVFVLLTGLSAYLYGQNKTKEQLAQFLLSRGIILVLLELTVISVAWGGSIPPTKLYLQVIWVIGLSMILMSALIYLPRWAQWLFATSLIIGHNFLDQIILSPDDALHTMWAILHQRDWIFITEELKARTSYPLIPWPGIMLLGYLLGKWFNEQLAPQRRIANSIKLSVGLLAAFFILRLLNIYGDTPWFEGTDPSQTIMSFFALTKYPPSLLFTLFTLAIGGLVLALFEYFQHQSFVHRLLHFGSAPMFFYIAHLYFIGITYLICISIWGRNHGKYFVLDSLWSMWGVFLILIIPLYFSTRWFGRLKQRRRDIRWLKYF